MATKSLSKEIRSKTFQPASGFLSKTTAYRASEVDAFLQYVSDRASNMESKLEVYKEKLETGPSDVGPIGEEAANVLSSEEYEELERERDEVEKTKRSVQQYESGIRRLLIKAEEQDQEVREAANLYSEKVRSEADEYAGALKEETKAKQEEIQEETRASAREIITKANNNYNESKAQAEKILQEAEEKAEGMILKAEAEVDRLNKERDAIIGKLDDIKSSFGQPVQIPDGDHAKGYGTNKEDTVQAVPKG